MDNMFTKNFGVIPGRLPRDWVASQIPYKVENESGDWTDFLPPGEWQRNNFVDTMACVTFSLLNCIETIEKFKTGKQVNYSDRWIALMSGTTKQGNYLSRVAQAVREYGLVKEESWPAPDNYNWDSYYALPSAEKMAELKAEGAEWKRTRDLNYAFLYEITPAEISLHLKQSPLQIVEPGHATTGYKQVGTTTHKLDHYNPFLRTIKTSRLTDAMKVELTIKEMQPTFVHITGTPQYGLQYDTEFVKTVVLFTSIQDAQEKLKTSNIDFSKAKEIQL